MTATKSKRYTARKVLFPRRHTFTQLFAMFEPYIQNVRELTHAENGRAISRYCNRSGVAGFSSLSVTPQKDVLEAVMNATAHVGSLSLYWSLTDRDDGTTLVTAQWDQIIGSVWVALIDTDSIPKV